MVSTDSIQVDRIGDRADFEQFAGEHTDLKSTDSANLKQIAGETNTERTEPIVLLCHQLLPGIVWAMRVDDLNMDESPQEIKEIFGNEEACLVQITSVNMYSNTIDF